MATYDETYREVPTPALLARAAGQVLAGLLHRLARASRARRRAGELRRTLLMYRGIEDRLLQDAGLSTAIVESALAGEEWAVAAFRTWYERRAGARA